MTDFQNFSERIREGYYDDESTGMKTLIFETDAAVTAGRLSKEEQSKLFDAWNKRQVGRVASSA